MIIRGKDRGETGIIKRVIRSQNRVIVEGKNLVRIPSFRVLWPLLSEINFRLFYLMRVQVKKHIKQGQGHEGGIFTVEAQQLLHPSDVGVKIEELQ
ncbi:hypothetical protein Ancab_022269 [Ancistrocladus abbreviatus]